MVLGVLGVQGVLGVLGVIIVLGVLVVLVVLVSGCSGGVLVVLVCCGSWFAVGVLDCGRGSCLLLLAPVSGREFGGPHFFISSLSFVGCFPVFYSFMLLLFLCFLNPLSLRLGG